MGRSSLDLARRQHDALANHRRIFQLMSELGGVPENSSWARAGG